MNSDLINIILEGPDRSGKSTLKDQLYDTYQLNLVHFTAPKDNLTKTDYVLTPGISVFWQIYNWVMNNSIKNNQSMIFDRFAYSDTVYGPIYRNFGDVYFGQYETVFMNLLMRSIGTIVVHCQLEDAEKNWQLVNEENEGYLDKDRLMYVRNKYDEIFKDPKFPLPVFHYDFMKNSFKDVFEFYDRENKRYNKTKKFLDEYGLKGKIIGNLDLLINDKEQIDEKTCADIVVLSSSKAEYITYEDFIKAIINYPDLHNRDFYNDNIIFVSNSNVVKTLLDKDLIHNRVIVVHQFSKHH